jgi:hypothetical protein
MRELPLSDWLALREAVDHASRSRNLVDLLLDALPTARPLRVLDLGAGAGSNIRFLSACLPGPWAWRAVDRDAALMTRLPAGVEARCLDLGRLDDPELFSGVRLVTASALLDLVSPQWIGKLAARCRDVDAAVLFALNYNGWSSSTPVDPDDHFVLDLFNRHQRSNDKGFGLAAGPGAVDDTVNAFTRVGYEIRTARSDWNLAPDADRLQIALIEGWACAASEMAPRDLDRIGRWLGRRLAHVRAGRSQIMVGHVDLAAWRIRSRG